MRKSGALLGAIVALLVLASTAISSTSKNLNSGPNSGWKEFLIQMGEALR